MKIASLLEIECGITAIIGGGGKTTLMYTLADELSESGSVIICTSTKIYRPDNYTVITDMNTNIPDALRLHGTICIGTPAGNGKLAAPSVGFYELEKLADYVIVEADGSKGLPLKAHCSYEPVIPENTKKIINVVGADGFGKPINEVCHRPQLYADMANTVADALVTPEIAAVVIIKENLSELVYINKVEDNQKTESAKRLSALLPCRVVAGSLHKGEYICL